MSRRIFTSKNKEGCLVALNLLRSRPISRRIYNVNIQYCIPTDETTYGVVGMTFHGTHKMLFFYLVWSNR